ncbi:MAG TPA: sensor histidine kinase, partial [Clostridium sp.]|nr:sensor histidine kinase [Clostridium sp.]
LTNSDYNLEKNKVNISMILNQAVLESMINFIERDIEVVLDNKYSEVYCYADAAQMQRVFDNLIRNAEKYADSNSKFLVSVKVIDKKVNISFMNKCQNIKDKDVKRLFEKFYREDKARSKEGSGLGLAIVKAILELHNGDITAEKIDDNIKFNITLEKV